MLYIVRELTKLMMFAIIWLLPFGLAYVFSNQRYLWFFILSFFVSISIFSHYEDLTKAEKEDKTILEESDDQ